MLILDNNKNCSGASIILALLIGCLFFILADFHGFNDYIKDKMKETKEAIDMAQGVHKTKGDEAQLIEVFTKLAKIQNKTAAMVSFSKMEGQYIDYFYSSSKYKKLMTELGWEVQNPKISKKTIDSIIGITMKEIDNKIAISSTDELDKRCGAYNYICMGANRLLLPVTIYDEAFNRTLRQQKYNFEHLDEYNQFLDERINMAAKKQDWFSKMSPGEKAYPRPDKD